MPRKKEIPKNPRYDLVAERAYRLLVEIGAEKLPISTYDIIEKYTNIQIEKYTELASKHVLADGLDFDKRNAIIDKMNEAEPDPYKWREHLEAIVVKLRGKHDYLIIFDDRVENKPRKRWSIGHELGHIFCGHLIDYELTSLFRSGLTPEEYRVLELEAHRFASELFGPTPVLLLLNTRFFNSKIELLCGLSDRAAKGKNRQLNKANVSDFNNYQLLFNFNEFIFSKGYLQSLYTTFQAGLRDNPRLYWDKYDVCRVCPSCYTFIDECGYRYCHICGEFIGMPRMNGRLFLRFEELSFLEGKIYPAFEESKSWRALFCPICKNDSLKGECCSNCNTPLYNRCLHEGKKLSLKYRRCPSCGKKTTYSNIYDTIKDVRIPPLSRFKGYDSYEWWGFVRYMIKIKEGLDLYSLLIDSVVYTDDDYYVLVFAGDEKYRLKLLNNLPVVTKYLETYGLASVVDICLYHYERDLHQIFWIAPSGKKAPFS